jgi:DNA modification methylase
MIDNDSQLAQLSHLDTMLAQATSIDEITDIRDKVRAMQVYAQNIKASKEEIIGIAEARIKAERRAGQELRGMELTPGGDGSNQHVKKEQWSSNSTNPTLEDMNISKYNSSKWQLISWIPDDVFEEELEKCHEFLKEPTTEGFANIGKRYKPRGKNIVKNNIEGEVILYCGEAQNMHMLPDEIADLIVTSPPYNLGHESWPMGGAGRIPRRKGVGYVDMVQENQYQDWQVDCLNECYRVATQGASMFYNHKTRVKDGKLIHPMDWIRDSLWVIRQEIIWDRKSTHNHSASLFWPEDERIYWLTKNAPKLPDAPIGKSSIWREFGPIPNNSWHPAPFTIKLPEMIIRAIGIPGGTILDPFVGSGTTLKAATKYGYKCIGVDSNQEYLKNVCEETGWTIENAT